jgi:hypothetical protein
MTEGVRVLWNEKGCGFRWAVQEVREEIIAFLGTNGWSKGVNYWRMEDCWQ